MRRRTARTLALGLVGLLLQPRWAFSEGHLIRRLRVRTATPIQHVVVIFQENISFDHYFATYPIATNPRE